MLELMSEFLLSDNLGTTWNYLGEYLPNSPITDLVLHNPTRKLIAATYGRSMYSIELSHTADITVTSPNGGEFWLVGSLQNILWTSNEVDSVKIELSLDNGVGWYTIADSTQSDGEFEWIAEPPHTSLQCRIRISNINVSTIYDKSDTTFVIDILPSVSDSSNLLPTRFTLYQNYPNPFNPSTKIKYEIPDQVRNDIRLVTLKVYDVLGNEVATLVNEEKQPGTYEVEFSAKGGSASGGNAYSLPSGIYFYQLKAGNYVETKKMVLIK